MKLLPGCLPLALAVGLFAQTGCSTPTATDDAAATESAPQPVAAFVTINGEAISRDRAELLTNEIKQHSPAAQADPDLENMVRAELVRRTVLEQAAIQEGIDKQPDTLAQIDLTRQSELIRSYLHEWAANNPTNDEELKKEYNTITERLGRQEYHARHILLDSENKAQAVIAKLKKGGKFATLARNSLDPTTKKKGGDLGWASPTMFVPAFADALKTLGKGKYTTTPVKTEFGYHVIYLEGVRERAEPLPSFESVKYQLQQGLQQQKVEAHIDELVKAADVK
jgi:peptidyl-prolyl cis-trans isomerase C